MEPLTDYWAKEWGKVMLNMDISDQHAIKQAISEGVERFGGIDILVNNTRECT
jgi:NADP-dependent 3-hydroxy acid dehydrogenase YdfG